MRECKILLACRVWSGLSPRLLGHVDKHHSINESQHTSPGSCILLWINKRRLKCLKLTLLEIKTTWKLNDGDQLDANWHAYALCQQKFCIKFIENSQKLLSKHLAVLLHTNVLKIKIPMLWYFDWNYLEQHYCISTF